MPLKVTRMRTGVVPSFRLLLDGATAWKVTEGMDFRNFV